MHRRFLGVAAAFWVLFALFGSVQTYLVMITHGHSFLRILFFQLCVWLVWLALTPIVAALGREFPVVPPRARTIAIHLLAALVIGVFHVTAWIALTVWIQPYDAMTITDIRSAQVQSILSRMNLELMIYVAVLAATQTLDVYAALRDREVSLSRARLHALELQIQPHFLFNTLHSIGGLVRNRRTDEAVEMIAGLSDLLRYSLDHAGNSLVPLGKEAEMLERYLGIQQVRFADRLTVSIDIPAEVRRARVPTLILQPLAENAIRHGVAQSASAGRVEVRAFRDSNRLRIELFNTGALSGRNHGLGIRNTEDRLRQLYGDAQSFTLAAANGGVVASLTIPWSES